MARDLAGNLAVDGRAILSGLLAEQQRMVLAAHVRQVTGHYQGALRIMATAVAHATTALMNGLSAANQ